jgi:hypothetical protein
MVNHNYLECYVVYGCTYNQQYLELYFLLVQLLFVGLPVWRSDGKLGWEYKSIRNK